MRTYKDETWEWVEEKGIQECPFAGKYLFFSSDRSVLKTIARKEIALHNFTCATVLLEPDEKRGKYMLCIYDSNNRREGELALRYANNEVLEYIGWIGKTIELNAFFHKMCVEKKELF